MTEWKTQLLSALTGRPTITLHRVTRGELPALMRLVAASRGM